MRMCHALKSSPQQTVLEAAVAGGVSLPHQCNGTGRCSTCRVWVLDGEEHLSARTQVEAPVAERLGLDSRVRLACQTRVSGDITVRRMILDSEEIIAAAPETVGREEAVVIMFTDLRDFTPFSERLPPHDVIYILERYYARMNAAVEKHGGFISNFLGDGLLVLFDHDSSTDMGGRAARAVIIGTVGRDSGQRQAVIGDTVNVASRIESATKKARCTTLVSSEFAAIAPDTIQYGRTVRARLKGKRGVYRLQELVGTGESADVQQTSIRKGSTTWYRSVSASALEPGQPIRARAGEHQLLILSNQGKVHAFEDRCPHMRLPLQNATVENGCELQCAWHHSRFDLDTGEVRAWAPWPNLVGPLLGAMRRRRGLQTYSAKVLKGWVWVGIHGKR